MMSHHSDVEEQQINELKGFIKKYWQLIVIILIIALAAVWGWRYWQSHHSAKLAQSSETFEALVVKLDAKNPDSVKELVAFSDSENNVYGILASLKAAQFYVEDLKDYPGAQALLENAAKKTKDNAVLGVIYTRIARLQYQQGLNDQSLQTLDKIKGEGWLPAVNDIRGDIFVKQGHYDEAIAAYQAALEEKPATELASNVQMKLNDALYQQQKQANVSQADNSAAPAPAN
ncbi:tetratricopeptide repeat protein [Utexia brackfieldae]|uniref:YfgM family protein n=1 Tax=Utexia brackfieldae TaxID=3074108 RepID=UPI00370D2FDD